MTRISDVSPLRDSATASRADHQSVTEAALVKCFLKSLPSGTRSHGAPERILLYELAGLIGQPDVVDVHFQALPAAIDIDLLAMSLRSPSKAQVLALLKNRVPRRKEYLQKLTGFAEHTLRSHLRDLESVGLVKAHNSSSVSLNCHLPWTMANIVVYEGKLTNWRRALHQAIGYRSFSHQVWVVMPISGAVHAAKVASVFYNNGIGLISVGEDGTVKKEIRSKRLRPTSRRLYLMAVGTVLSRFVAEGRRLHRRIRPETVQST